MYQIIGSFNKKIYNKFIELLIEASDSYIFHLPNMGKVLVNKRNFELMSEHPLGYTEENHQDKHYEYINRMNKYIDIVREDIINSYIDTGYLDQISNLAIEVYHMAISKNTKKFFEQTEDLSKWMYPYLPENPCFISKGKCVFQSIIHEDLYFLYVRNKKIIKFLRENNFKVNLMINTKVPTLDECIKPS